MLLYCWASIVANGQALPRHCVGVSCLLSHLRAISIIQSTHTPTILRQEM